MLISDNFNNFKQQFCLFQEYFLCPRFHDLFVGVSNDGNQKVKEHNCVNDDQSEPKKPNCVLAYDWQSCICANVEVTQRIPKNEEKE